MARNLSRKKSKNPILIIAFILGILLLIIPLKVETDLGLLPETGQELDLSVEIASSREHLQKDSLGSEEREIDYTIKAVNNSECIQNNLNVIFLIDSSGSISASLSQIKIDIKQLLDYMDFETDKAGIVAFNDSASIIQSITQDKSTLISNIYHVSSSGMSNLGEGIQTSMSELENQVSSNGSEKYIVIFTDGLPDRPYEEDLTDLEHAKDYAIEKAKEADEAGISIVTISYGSFADDNFLESISNSGSRGSVKSQDDNSIKGIYSLMVQDESTTASDVALSVDLNASRDIVKIKNLSSGGTYTNGKLDWTIGSLQCKQTAISNFTLKITDEASDLDLIDLVAELSSSESETLLSSNAVTTIHAPNMNFTVTDDKSEVLPGEKLDYQINIENLGTGNAYISSVTSSFNDLLEINQTSYTGATFENSQLTWENNSKGFILDGSYAPSGSDYGNSIHLNYSGDITSSLDPDIYDIETTATLTTESGMSKTATDETQIPYVPDLYISKTSKPPTYTYGGGTVIYTLEVGNKGYTDAVDVKVTDEFDPTISSIRAENGRVAYDTISWSIDKLARGESEELTYTAIINEPIPDGSTISNVATITSSITDYDTSDNTAFKELETTKSPVLDIQKSSDALSYESGSELGINLVIYNNSYADSYDTILEETLPENMKYVQDSSMLNGASHDDPQGTNILKWSLGDLSKSEFFEFSYKIKIDETCLEGNYSISTTLSWQDTNRSGYAVINDEVTISVIETTSSIPDASLEIEDESVSNEYFLKLQNFVNKLPVTGESALFIKIVIGICLAIPLPIMLIFDKKKSRKTINF